MNDRITLAETEAAGELPRGVVAAAGSLPLTADQVIAQQAYWVARGYLLEMLERPDEAKVAWKSAMELTDDPVLREHLAQRMAGK